MESVHLPLCSSGPGLSFVRTAAATRKNAAQSVLSAKKRKEDDDALFTDFRAAAARWGPNQATSFGRTKNLWSDVTYQQIF